MSVKIYTYSFDPNWMLLSNEMSQIDRFDASWSNIEKKESHVLKELKLIATVSSVGASTRIEGSKMTDDEVKSLISNIKGFKLEERDQQEVAGYFETLELITRSFQNISITESNLLHLHNTLMKFNENDSWHKGRYKQHSNAVEAKNPDGSRSIIFKPTDPGFATEDAIRKLIEWYSSDGETLPLIKIAVFIYDFLSIHPFQDGNGRLSRLLSTLLLMKQGYSWIEYMSFEREIENRKSEYYKVLMECQSKRPGEDVYPWVSFFLSCLKNIQQQLTIKLEVIHKAGPLIRREKIIYAFIENHPSSQSGEIARKLNIPLPTVKRQLAQMVKSRILLMQGSGAGVHYNIMGNASIKKDLAMRFTDIKRKKEWALTNQVSFIEIKKIILIPLFNWTLPDEWYKKLNDNDMSLLITCINGKGDRVSQPYTLTSYASPNHYNPVFELDDPINIPGSLMERMPFKKDYPLQTTVELISATDKIDFNVMLIYDEA